MKRPEQPSIPGIDTVESGSGATAHSRKRPKRAGAPGDTPGLKVTVSAFHDAYVKAYDARPTWGAKQIGMVKRLVKQHGADEVQRRIAVLFETGLGKWPEPPYTIAVLVSQFDRLVGVKTGARRPSDVLGKVGGK